MKIVCSTSESELPSGTENLLSGLLYARSDNDSLVTAGASVREVIERAKIAPDPRACDLLNIGLSIILADTAVTRDDSPDGWTRQIQLTIPVRDYVFWSDQVALLENQLQF